MSKTIKQIRLDYDEKNLVVDETFPVDLEGILEEPDFEAVVRKINLELNQDILEMREEMQRWARIFGYTAIFMVGLFFTPVLWVKSKHYKLALEAYWNQIESYLKVVTKKSVAKRKDKWVEWKLNQSGHKKRGTDVFDPHFTWQVVVVVKVRTKKGAAYVPKQLSKAPEPIDDDADTSITGFEGERSERSSAPDFSGLDRRVSFAQPDDSGASTSAGAVAGAGLAAVAAGLAVAGSSGEDENRISAASTLSPITPAGEDNRLSAASTLSPVEVNGRPESSLSIDEVDLGNNNNRSSVISTTSISPLEETNSASNRLSSISIAPIEGEPGDRSSTLSLAPIVIAEPESKPSKLPTLMEAEEGSTEDLTSVEKPMAAERILSPVLSEASDDKDPEFPAIPEDEKEDSIGEADLPQAPEEPASEESSIEALALHEFESAEDHPEDLPVRVLSDSESGSII